MGHKIIMMASSLSNFEQKQARSLFVSTMTDPSIPSSRDKIQSQCPPHSWQKRKDTPTNIHAVTSYRYPVAATLLVVAHHDNVIDLEDHLHDLCCQQELLLLPDEGLEDTLLLHVARARLAIFGKGIEDEARGKHGTQKNSTKKHKGVLQPTKVCKILVSSTLLG